MISRARMLSEDERSLWALQEQTPEMAAYNIVLPIRTNGNVNVEGLQKALAYVAFKHPVLNSRIDYHGSEPHFLLIDAPPSVSTLQLHCSGTQAEAELLATIRLEGMRPFVLCDERPLRALLISCGSGDTIVLTIHHIAADAASVRSILDDLAAAYGAYERGEHLPLPTPLFEAPPVNGSGDAVRSHMLAEWCKLLSGAPKESTLARRRAGRPRTFSFRGSSCTRALPSFKEMESADRTIGASPFAWTVAAVAYALAINVRRDDLVLGVTMSMRDGFDNEVGYQSRLLPIRLQNMLGRPFARVLEDTVDAMRTTYGLSEVPFASIAEALDARSARKNPLCQIVCNYTELPQSSITLGNLRGQLLEVHNGSAKFDFTFDVRVSGNDAYLDVTFCEPLYDRGEAEKFVDQVLSLLTAALEDRSFIPAFTAQAQRAAADSAATLLHTAFLNVVERTPDAIALSYGQTHLTYRELAEQARAIAGAVQKHGAAPERFVALILEPSLPQIAAILGVLLSGAAYVPIGADWPADRIRSILDEVNPVALLVADDNMAAIPSIDGIPVIAVHDALTAAPISKPVVLDPQGLAYVIYTSGSTGHPKGVMVSHASVMALMRETFAQFELSSADVWSMFHGYTFDFSVFEVWGALLAGARLAVVPRSVTRTPDDFYSFLIEQGVTVLCQTPSAFKNLSRVVSEHSDGRDDLALRYVVFGGEALHPASVAQWFLHFGDARPVLVNMYGITETTVHVTHRRLSQSDVHGITSPIGAPLSHLGVHILDPQLNVVGGGTVGELYVEGAGLARGYLQNPSYTAERFIPNPFSSQPGARMYRSGDLACYRDGELTYHGRGDDQVKISGFRIELGEVERALLVHPGVSTAAVAAIERDGEAQLLACYVSTTGASIDERSVRAVVAERLPSYMVPGVLYRVDMLPLTSNGKVDRNALARMYLQHSEASTSRRPRRYGEFERAWGRVLGCNDVGPNDDFFQVGGNSLTAIRLAAELSTLTGKHVPVRTIFENTRFEDLVQHVTSDATITERAEVSPMPAGTASVLTPQQEASYASYRKNRLDTSENVPIGFCVDLPLDEARAAAALHALVLRHHALRTAFFESDAGVVQVVNHHIALDFTSSEVATAAASLETLVKRAIREPFDLQSGAPMRVRMWKLSSSRTALLFVIHHIVTDGASAEMLLREFVALYDELCGKRHGALLPVRRQFIEFAQWQVLGMSGVLSGQIAYWNNVFNETRQIAEVPKRLSCGPPTGVAKSFVMQAPEGLWRVCESFGKQKGSCTPFAILLAAWALVLRSNGLREPFLMRFAAANRERVEFRNTFGRLAHGAYVRLEAESHESFGDVVARTWTNLQSAYANQEAPLEEVFKARAQSANDGITARGACSFTLQDDPLQNLLIGEHSLKYLELPSFETTKRDLSVYFYRQSDSLAGHLIYDTGVLTEERANHLLQALFRTCAAGIAAPAKMIDEFADVTYVA